MTSLAGKTLFVTGGSRGIGLAIAKKAAEDGANIVIAAKTDKPHPKLPGTIHTAAEEIEEAGGNALPLVCDIRDDDAVAAAVEQGAEAFGGIDIVVNNASAIALLGTEAVKMSRFDLMHQVNARGTFLVSKTCLPWLRKSENPHILVLAPPLNMGARHGR
jgi:citronellol/citronellal dehydrogenase